MIKLSAKLLIANKGLLYGWNLIEKLAKKYRTKVIPVDSEHFSILELLKNHKLHEIEKVYLTASGGPFLNFKYNRLKRVSPKQALNHPKWIMGKNLNELSTLINKILELIEAHKILKFQIKNLIF